MSIEYTLSAEAMIFIQGSSKGTQPKYFDGGYWYKTNQLGYEGQAEFLASKVLECSNIKDFVKYEECIINGRSGCRCANFLSENESFISFERLFSIHTGGNLTDNIRQIPDLKGRIDFVRDFIKNYTGVDCKEYLSQVLSFDMLILNTDRHFNNLGIIANSTKNTFRTAPLFDHGNSLLSDWERFSEETLQDNISRVIGQPFAANLEIQANTADIGLKLNYQKLAMELKGMPPSRGLDVLKYQLDRYQEIIPQMKESEIFRS